MPKAGKLGEIYVAVNAKLDKFEKDLKKMKGQAKTSSGKVQKSFDKINLKKASKSLLNFKNVLMATVGYAMARLTKQIISLSNAQEAVERRLSSVIQSTGMAAGFTAEEMYKMASAMQRVTTVGDEVILSGMAMLSTFKTLGGDVFQKTMMAALDLSEVMQQDLRSSIVMLGKAINDPVANLGALSRAGIQFTKDQKEIIKTLWEEGKTFEAQKLLLAEIESQFGGAAKAAKDTFGGAMKSTANVVGDFKEELGFAITKNQIFIGLVKDTETYFTNLIPKVRETVKRFHAWSEANQAVIDSVSTMVGWMPNLLTWLVRIGKQATFWDEILAIVRAIDKLRGKPAAEGPAGGQWEGSDMDAFLDKLKGVGTTVKDVAKIVSESPIVPRLEGFVNLDHLISKIKELEKAEKDRTEAAEDDKQFWDDYYKMQIEAATKIDEEWTQAYEDMETALDDLQNKSTETAKYMEEMWADTVINMKNAFSDFFYDAITGQLDTLRDYINSFADAMARTLSNILSSMMWESILSAMPTSGGTYSDIWARDRQGRAYGPQGALPLARGGIIDKPTIFPFAGGVGLMGEAGPEAVMPLKRTASGDLGVQAEGGGTTIINNINAMDVRSFSDFLQRNPGAVTGEVIEQANYGNKALLNAFKAR